MTSGSSNRKHDSHLGWPKNSSIFRRNKSFWCYVVPKGRTCDNCKIRIKQQPPYPHRTRKILQTVVETGDEHPTVIVLQRLVTVHWETPVLVGTTRLLVTTLDVYVICELGIL